MMGATSGAETAHSSGAPESIPPLFFFFTEVRVAQSFFSVQFFVHHCLSFCPFFLGIVPSVLFIASDYHYGILNFLNKDAHENESKEYTVKTCIQRS